MRLNCVCCGKEFVSYNPNPMYCSRVCRSRFEMADVDVEEAKRLYESGLSQDEVAASLGIKQSLMSKVFKRIGYKCRTTAKRNQVGPANDSWVGDEASYKACHNRVRSIRGTPSKCDWCGTEDGVFEWANLTGHYLDVNDFVRLCRSCHHFYDNDRRKDTGESTMKIKR